MRAVLLLALVCAAFGLAPLNVAQRQEDAIAGQYIVVLQKGAAAEAAAAHRASVKGTIIASFSIGDFQGYSAKLDDAGLNAVRADKLVQYVDQDQIVRIVDAPCVTQADAEWNLHRVSSPTPNPEDSDYEHSENPEQANIDAYVIDTGIRVTHQEFNGGRATWGTNTVGDGNNSDCHGHGTHVAGTVGGRLYGIAKGVKLIAVKVLNCQGSGTWTGVVQGIEWVTNAHRSSGRKSVANMSLGGGYMQSVNDATTASVNAGVVHAVAAGNSNADACNSSPASATGAICVGSTALVARGDAQIDERSSFSNWGPCTKVFAPGTAIKSAYHTSDTATTTMSGTSMASPHVAGVACVVLAQNPSFNPAQVLQAIESGAGKNLIDMKCSSPACSQSPNLMLHKKC